MAKTDKDFIRRGDLYRIIQNIVRTEDIPLTYDNTVFLQRLVNKMNDQCARWPDGRTMNQDIRLDNDLILKDSFIDSLIPLRTRDKYVKIIEKVKADMEEYSS